MDGIPCEHGRLDFDLTIKNGDVTGGKWCCYVLFLECMGLSKMDWIRYTRNMWPWIMGKMKIVKRTSGIEKFKRLSIRVISGAILHPWSWWRSSQRVWPAHWWRQSRSLGDITPESFREGIEHEQFPKPLVVLQGGNLKLGTRVGPWQFDSFYICFSVWNCSWGF